MAKARTASHFVCIPSHLITAVGIGFWAATSSVARSCATSGKFPIKLTGAAFVVRLLRQKLIDLRVYCQGDRTLCLPVPRLPATSAVERTSRRHLHDTRVGYGAGLINLSISDKTVISRWTWINSLPLSVVRYFPSCEPYSSNPRLTSSMRYFSSRAYEMFDLERIRDFVASDFAISSTEAAISVLERYFLKPRSGRLLQVITLMKPPSIFQHTDRWSFDD